MKISIVFSLVIFPYFLFGQINHFGNLDSKWNVAKTYPAANQQSPTFVATTTTVYGFKGDTLINNEPWFMMYSTSDSLFQSNLVYRGLIKSENNKVFYIDTLNQLDTLYDFNLVSGDSVLFNLYGTFPEKLQVTEVDSVQINGEYYKRFHFSEPTGPNAFDALSEVWIEGIGSIHSPLFPNNPVKFSTEMPDSMLVSCTFSDNQLVWQHPSYSDCYINITLGIESQNAIDFKIYPNPFSDKIHVENNGIDNFNLRIVDVTGQVVRQVQVNSVKEMIDLTGLKSGVYFVKINNQRSSSLTKIVKN